MTNQVNALDITTLPPEERALIALDATQTEAQLLTLIGETATIKAVIDQNGRDQAHRMGMKLRGARVTIEKTGKAAREDAQAFSKAVIREEKRLISIIDGEEKRVLGLRDSFDSKIEAEKAAIAAAEAKRIADIREKIDGIRKLPLALAGADAATLSAEIQALHAFMPLKEVFAELTDECVREIKDCLETLDSLHLREIAREEAARVVANERERVAEEKRLSDEAIAKERAAMQAEREELARRREEIEAFEAERKANDAHQAAPTLESSLDVTELVVVTVSTEKLQAGAYEMGNTIPTLAMSVAPPTTDRAYAKAMSCQFRALAEKVDLCGFRDYAQELVGVAMKIWEGEHDDAIAKADLNALLTHDKDMMDHTAACIDAVGVAREAAFPMGDGL